VKKEKAKELAVLVAEGTLPGQGREKSLKLQAGPFPLGHLALLLRPRWA
jgi:hypothetical protein